jgi:hypothetical protein
MADVGLCPRQGAGGGAARLSHGARRPADRLPRSRPRWSRGLKTHSATIVPTPRFRGHTLHANPLRGFRFNLSLASVRERAESAIDVYLAGPEAQQRHNPRSWRAHHGNSDFKQAFDLAIGLSTSGEAARAYLDWLTVVARDEIEALWPHVEKVAQTLVRERTLTAAGVKALLASQ